MKQAQGGDLILIWEIKPMQNKIILSSLLPVLLPSQNAKAGFPLVLQELRPKKTSGEESPSAGEPQIQRLL